MSAFLSSLLLSSIFLTSLVESFNNDGITVDLYRHDSHHLPSYDPSTTHFQRLQTSFARAFSRKSSLLASSLSSLEAPIIPAGGEYLMKIKIGTPPVEQLGIADTGSDLTWIQCKPCSACYNQTLPLFDPKKTSSYRPVSCKSGQCAVPGSSYCDSRNSCRYHVEYGDNSYSNGELAVETLTFGIGVSFPKVAFGCGQDNDGTFRQTGSSGIIGLGGGSISIINQLQSHIKGKFSYCLTLLNSNATSKISFGNNAIVAGPKVVSTPFLKYGPDTFYYLTLEGISVGAKRLNYVSSTKAANVEEGNIIIDSGTPLTFVPSEMYDGVELALEKAIKGATRVSDPQGSLSLCYEKGSHGRFRPPPITAHFKGADLVLNQESTFVEVEKGIICLTIVPSEDFAIFGNLHQMNYHVGYDLVKQQVSFLPTDCSKPL